MEGEWIGTRGSDRHDGSRVARRRRRRERAVRPIERAERRVAGGYNRVGHRRRDGCVRGRTDRRRAPESRRDRRAGGDRPLQWTDVPGYIAAQMVGAVIGAALVWIAYLPHWAVTPDKDLKLAVFCTAPAIDRRSRTSSRKLSAPPCCCSACSRFARTPRRFLGRVTSISRWSSAAGPAASSAVFSCWASGSRSADQRVTRSILRATSGRGSRTRCCRSLASATATGSTLDSGRRTDLGWRARRACGSNLCRVLAGSLTRL